MNKIDIYPPNEHIKALQDLRKIPFAKTEDGYRFAYWIYDLNDTEENRQELEMGDKGEDVVKLIEKAKTELKNIIVTEDDYLGWTVHKKESGGIKQYHEILHNLSIDLILLNIETDPESIIEGESTGHPHINVKDFYLYQNGESSTNGKVVLNRNNPFADVTIKSQQFFYKTEAGETETLFFNTNNIVEKVDKNGHDMLTMRPGFTVSKECGVVQRPMQKVTFANSVTEPIVEDEDHIYIHID